MRLLQLELGCLSLPWHLGSGNLTTVWLFRSAFEINHFDSFFSAHSHSYSHLIWTKLIEIVARISTLGFVQTPAFAAK
jgi:hypothetical protein